MKLTIGNFDCKNGSSKHPIKKPQKYAHCYEEINVGRTDIEEEIVVKFVCHGATCDNVRDFTGLATRVER